MKKVVSLLHMPEVAIGYGMTETSPISTLSARDDTLERRVATVGRVVPHVEISVRDPVSRAVLPRGHLAQDRGRGLPGFSEPAEPAQVVDDTVSVSR